MTNKTPIENIRTHYLYCITNTVNGKFYIGQSIEPRKRWWAHKNEATKDKPISIISCAIKKYGTEVFEFEIIAECKTWDDANDMETLLVSQYDCQVPKGYNVAPGGINSPKTEEWKRKVSQTLMGHEVTQESREKLSKSHMGKVLTEEHRKNIGIASSLRIHTEETKKKLSEINMGNKNSLGFHHTDEAKKRISEARKGKKPADITIQKAKEAFTGKTWKLIDGKRIWMDK
jgi:group I intron endonuclease